MVARKFQKLIIYKLELFYRHQDEGTQCVGQCQLDYLDCYGECGTDLACASLCGRTVATCMDSMFHFTKPSLNIFQIVLA